MSSLAARRRTRLLGAAGASVLIAGLAAVPASARHHRSDGEGQHSAPHVLLLSVDGMHQSDLAWYVTTHPGSALASLTNNGASFTNAQTQFPSDSLPGIVGQLTGGHPSSTGVYYDDTWNHALLPAGTTNCSTAKPGVEVQYMEFAAKNPVVLDSGQGLANDGYATPGNPNNILNLTPDSTSLLDPAKLPVDPTTCKPVYPHTYLRVNTVFEVARAAHLRTAWSDKHAAYEILNGPSGKGVQDMFTPEINSNAPAQSGTIDWTGDNALTMRYDSYKVQAVINEINGYDHSGSSRVGTPAVFGMNFQTVSTAQKLPCSPPQSRKPLYPRPCKAGTLPGGYEADGTTPAPLLRNALDYVNDRVGSMQSALRARGLAKSTTIILSAKHGQSPQNPAALTRIDDGAITDAINADWQKTHSYPVITFSVNDDGMLIWLDDHIKPADHQAAADFVRAHLLAMNGDGTDINGNPKPYNSSGLTQVYAGAAAAQFMGVDPTKEPGASRVPDVIAIAHYGTVFTGKQNKIAEHGGNNRQDRNMPLVVSGGQVGPGQTFADPVETPQIAPTILKLLGLDPNALQAVQMEHTAVLPVATTASSGGGGEQGAGGSEGGGEGASHGDSHRGTGHGGGRRGRHHHGG